MHACTHAHTHAHTHTHTHPNLKQRGKTEERHSLGNLRHSKALMYLRNVESYLQAQSKIFAHQSPGNTVNIHWGWALGFVQAWLSVKGPWHIACCPLSSSSPSSWYSRKLCWSEKFLNTAQEQRFQWPNILGWCKINFGFIFLKFVWYWNTFLNVIMLYIILMHISHFIFFFLLMTYYLLFIFILD